MLYAYPIINLLVVCVNRGIMRGLRQVLSLLRPSQGIRAKEGKCTVDSAVFSCHVMLMLSEMDARLDEHLGIMKRAVFIQIKILVNPSLGPPRYHKYHFL